MGVANSSIAEEEARAQRRTDAREREGQDQRRKDSERLEPDDRSQEVDSQNAHRHDQQRLDRRFVCGASRERLDGAAERMEQQRRAGDGQRRERQSGSVHRSGVPSLPLFDRAAAPIKFAAWDQDPSALRAKHAASPAFAESEALRRLAAPRTS